MPASPTTGDLRLLLLADQRGDAIGAFNLGFLLGERGDLVGAEEAYRRAEQRGNADEAGIARAALLDLHRRLQTQDSGRSEVIATQ
jgi:hypothetical protein